MLTPEGLTFPFRCYTILALANLLAYNDINQICNCGQISLQTAAVFLTSLGVPFILLVMVVHILAGWLAIWRSVGCCSVSVAWTGLYFLFKYSLTAKLPLLLYSSSFATLVSYIICNL